MASFGSFETVREVYSDPIYTVYSATRTGDPQSEYAIKVFSIHQTPMETGTAETLEPLLADIENARSDAIRVQAKAASASKFIAPVFLTGQDERGVWYATRFYPRSVNRIISGRVALGRDSLHHILRCIARGALDLKNACGRSHGGILPSNIQISKSERLNEAEIVLSDPLPGEANEAARYEIGDLNAIGRIMLQLIAQRTLAEHDFLILPILLSADWTRVFGREAEPWLTICNRLLSPSLSLAEYSLEQLVADLAALEPKQRFSPKWAIAAAAVVLLAVGGFFVVRSLTGGSTKSDQVETKPPRQETGKTEVTPPVTPEKSSAEIWSEQFNNDSELGKNEELKSIFAGLQKNETAFKEQLRAWWVRAPDTSNLPAKRALDAALASELPPGGGPDFSTNRLLDSIKARLSARQGPFDMINSLSMSWQQLKGKLRGASNEWAKLNQPNEFVGKLFVRDFESAMKFEALPSKLADYKRAFEALQNDGNKFDYLPPSNWRELPDKKRDIEMRSLLAIADGTVAGGSYDAWRNEVQKWKPVGPILTNVTGWPPNLDALEPKIAELRATFADPLLPRETSGKASAALTQFENEAQNIKTRIGKVNGEARDAVTRTDTEQVASKAAEIVKDYGRLSDGIFAATKANLAAIDNAKAADTAKQQLARDRGSAREFLAAGEYSKVFSLRDKWAEDAEIRSLAEKATVENTKLSNYQTQLRADNFEPILTADDLPANPKFRAVKEEAVRKAHERAGTLLRQDKWDELQAICNLRPADTDFGELAKAGQRYKLELERADRSLKDGDYASVIAIVNTNHAPTQGFTNVFKEAGARQRDFSDRTNNFVGKGDYASLTKWIDTQGLRQKPPYTDWYAKGTNYQSCSNLFALNKYIEARKACVSGFKSQDPFRGLLSRIAAGITGDYNRYQAQLKSGDFSFIADVDKNDYEKPSGRRGLQRINHSSNPNRQHLERPGSFSNCAQGIDQCVCESAGKIQPD